VLCSLANGNVFQFIADYGILRMIKENPLAYPPQVEASLKEESESLPGLPRALWNLKVMSVGDQEATLKKVVSPTHGPLVIA
jgi:hypothetical protein